MLGLNARHSLSDANLPKLRGTPAKCCLLWYLSFVFIILNLYLRLRIGPNPNLVQTYCFVQGSRSII